MIFNPHQLFALAIPDSDCYLCKQPVNSNTVSPNLLCTHCHGRLPLLRTGCPVCAMPVATHNQMVLSSLACGNCLKQSPSYFKTVSAFHYEPPISDFITDLKYNARHYFIPLLSFYLLKAIKQSYQAEDLPQLIIPVPLHLRKIRSRGFNQAQLIAENLAKTLKLPILTGHISRTRYTKAQSALNAEQRKKNLKGAFLVNNDQSIKNSRVVIVDDVITTGTTANELSIQLLAAGASRVDVWSIARAFPI